MANTPKISLVLTAYKFERYIGRAVESLLNQDGNHDLEVIVVDDCSPDGTTGVLEKFRPDPRFRFIRNATNQGSSVTCTIGLEAARGQYVARLDGDDEWYPNYLNETVKVLDENPNVGLVYGEVHTMDEHGQVNEASSIERPDLPQVGNELVPLLRRYHICAPAILARRHLWEAVLPIPETLKSGLSDWFTTLRMAQMTDFCYVPKPLAKYRVHSGGMHHAFVQNKIGERNMRIVLDHFLEKEKTPVTRQEYRKIYGSHYRTFANGYFRYDMTDDARRCYRKAAAFDPSLMLDRTFLFPMLGSFMGKSLYASVKRLLG